MASNTCTDKPFWARNLRLIGPNYYGGIVTNIDEVLEEHRRETHSTFGTRSSKKLPGLSGVQNPSAASCTSADKENESPKRVRF